MKKGAITLLDVLGWKGIWQRKPDPTRALQEIIKRAQRLRDYAIEEERSQDKDKENVFKGLETQVTSISDTIALATYGEIDMALQFHSVISSYILCDSIKNGLPVRGAICYGDYSFEDNIMVGSAVDEVASWYEKAEWVGVIYTPSALYYSNIDKYISKNIVELHNIYIKGHGNFNTYCVKWPTIWNKKYKREDLVNAFTELRPITPEIGFKLSNTLEFYDKITQASGQ